MTLTRDTLAQLLVKQIGLNGREAREMIERFYGEIATTLESGESVKLADFGEFSVREKSLRPGRTTRPGETSASGPRRVAEFHPDESSPQRKSGDGA
jgi:integration host factor subunit alpha